MAGEKQAGEKCRDCNGTGIYIPRRRRPGAGETMRMEIGSPDSDGDASIVTDRPTVTEHRPTPERRISNLECISGDETVNNFVRSICKEAARALGELARLVKDKSETIGTYHDKIATLENHVKCNEETIRQLRTEDTIRQLRTVEELNRLTHGTPYAELKTRLDHLEADFRAHFTWSHAPSR